MGKKVPAQGSQRNRRMDEARGTSQTKEITRKNHNFLIIRELKGGWEAPLLSLLRRVLTGKLDLKGIEAEGAKRGGEQGQGG